MLWTCLHFSDFSLQLRLRAGALSSGPLIVASGGNRPQVVSCNVLARRHGITSGMTVSAAIALAPDLVECLRDPAAEMQALEGAAAWAGQFTSFVSVSPPDALLLEIEGSVRLFGGLRMLLLHLSRELGELGYTAAIASAPTPTAAPTPRPPGPRGPRAPRRGGRRHATPDRKGAATRPPSEC